MAPSSATQGYMPEVPAAFRPGGTGAYAYAPALGAQAGTQIVLDGNTTGVQAARDGAKDVTRQANQPWTAEMVTTLSRAVLAFTFATLVLASVLLWRLKSPPQLVVKVFGLLVILGFSCLLLVVGYSNEQLTPIVGLFGAIGGYLLGKDSSSGGSA